MPFLEDETVQAILASVKVIKEAQAVEPTSNNAAGRNVGTDFSVFAVDAPSDTFVEEGFDFMRIDDAAGALHMNLWSMTPGPATTATSAMSYLEWHAQEYGGGKTHHYVARLHSFSRPPAEPTRMMLSTL